LCKFLYARQKAGAVDGHRWSCWQLHVFIEPDSFPK
jgi:hypothetical protein